MHHALGPCVHRIPATHPDHHRRPIGCGYPLLPHPLPHQPPPRRDTLAQLAAAGTALEVAEVLPVEAGALVEPRVDEEPRHGLRDPVEGGVELGLLDADVVDVAEEGRDAGEGGLLGRGARRAAGGVGAILE